MTAIHIPQTADDPDARALAGILASECEPSEALAVIPDNLVIKGLTQWRRFRVICTTRGSGARRSVDVVAVRGVADALGYVVAGRGVSRALLRSVLAADAFSARGLAFLVDFATDVVTDVFHDHNGPGGEQLPWATHGPVVKDGALVFFTERGFKIVTVALEGEGLAEPVVRPASK